jgi:hypothetical protein
MTHKPRIVKNYKSIENRRAFDLGSAAKRKRKPEPLHVDEKGNPRSPDWIKWMQKGYRGGSKKGVVAHGRQNKENATTRIDKDLKEQAIAIGIKRSPALEMALRILMSDQIDQLIKLKSKEIYSITEMERKVVIVDYLNLSYTGQTKLEALLNFLIGRPNK